MLRLARRESPFSRDLGAALRRPVVVLLVSIAAAFALYGSTLRFGYVLDDGAMIRDNPEIRKIDLRAIFGSSAEKSYKGQVDDFYRPIGVLTFALNYRLDGLNTWGYRIVNILLHGLCAFLLYELTRVLLRRWDVPLLAAAFFLVHPVHTEVVAQIKGRFELLATLFGLLSLRLFLARGTGALIASAASFLVAMLSKENAFGLLLVYPAADWVRAGAVGNLRAVAASIRREWTRYFLLLLCVILVILARYEVLGHLSQWRLTNPLDNPIVAEAPSARIFTALKVIPLYVEKLVFPVRLSADYSFNQIPVSRSFLEPGPITGALCIAAWLAGLAWTWKRSPAGLFGLVLLGATFVVQSNLIVPIGTIMGERLLYLPSTGYCLLFALAWCAAIRSSGLAHTSSSTPATCLTRVQGWMLFSALLSLVLLMGTRVLVRNEDWKSDHALFRSAARVSPNSAKVLQALGRGGLEAGEYEESAAIYRRAIEIMPQWRCTRIGLAKALIGMNRDEDAMRELAQVDKPPERDPEAHYLMGLIALRAGKSESAAEEFSLSADLWPDYSPAAFNLAYAFYKLGRYDEASQRYEKAFDDFPQDSRTKRELPRFIESLERVSASVSAQADWAKGVLKELRSTEIPSPQQVGSPPDIDPAASFRTTPDAR